MPSVSDNNKRIAKNALLLYVRMFITMLISLYTSRVVLNTLGVENYGIYNVVGGVVATMGVLNGALSTSIQRFLNYELGAGGGERLRLTFSMSLNIYGLFALIFVVLAETLGLWFLNTHLTIPTERLVAANYVYQFSIFTTVVSLLGTPYNAAIVAHERMDVYAYTSILEVVLKLVVVFLLLAISFDKLIGYGLFVACASCAVTAIYYLFCRKHFAECRYRVCWDGTLFRSLFSYFSWNLFGSAAGVAKTEGLNVLLNVFFNPIVNAARGIACLINNVLMQFFNNFYTAVRPQIIKYYAQGNTREMMDLVFRSTKYSFFLCLLVSLPVLIEAPFLINLWLGQLPAHAVAFTRLIVVISVIDALASPIMTAAHATGRIKLYQFVVGSIMLCNIPVSYCLLKVFANPLIVYWVSLALTATAFVVRLFILKRLINFSIRQYLSGIVLRIAVLTVLSSLLPVALSAILREGFGSSVSVIAVSLLSCCGVIWGLGMNRSERAFVVKAISNKMKRYGIGR